jgi:hypothetical protein
MRNNAGNNAGTDGSVPILLSKRCDNRGQFRLSPHFSDVGHVRSAVSVLVFHAVEDDGESLRFLALAIPLVVFREQGALPGDGGAVVAGGDEFFEAELVEVGGEVLEEVALEWVVAIAVDDLAAEGAGVELEVGLDLFLDVDVLGVELVLLRFSGLPSVILRAFVAMGLR